MEAQKQEFIRQGVPEKNIRIEVGSAADNIKQRPVFSHLIDHELKENDLLLVTKKIKYDDDYIFTKDIDGQVPLRRETLTRILNNELNSVGVDLEPPRKLSSRNFQIWDHKN